MLSQLRSLVSKPQYPHKPGPMYLYTCWHIISLYTMGMPLGKYMFRLFVVTAILLYISKWAIQGIQVDFFTTYPELNPANISVPA